MPDTMLAYRPKASGPADLLSIEYLPIPAPTADQVLIRVAACGINRADIVQRLGLYPPPPGASDILGLEVSGIVQESHSPKFSPGQEVCALLAGGGYAEYVAVDAGQVIPIPQGLSLIEAAALPEASATVWATIFMQCHLLPNELVLIHGGSSGIGTHAIQYAKYWGARVATTAGSDDKLKLCQKLGSDICINYRTQNFGEILSHQVDVILDMVGGSYLKHNIQCLKTYGRMVTIAIQGGATAELNLWKLMEKRASIAGTTIRARELTGPHGKAAIMQGVYDNLWPAIEQAKVMPIIGATFPFSDAVQAHLALESGKTTGKILLVL